MLMKEARLFAFCGWDAVALLLVFLRRRLRYAISAQPASGLHNL